jgi:hypothetical protein
MDGGERRQSRDFTNLREDPPASPVPVPDPDEEAARAYADGYGEGVRNALRDIIGLASQGHSASEIRLFAQTRLARLGEEIALKRRSRLVPPDRIPLETLLRGPRALGGGEPVSSPLIAFPGHSYLFVDPRGLKARGFLHSLLERGMAAVALTRFPRELKEAMGRSNLKILYLGRQEASEEGVESVQDADPGLLTGRIQRALEGFPSPPVIHLEAFEYLETEVGFEKALKFIHWLTGEVQARRGVLIVSLDPVSLEPRQLSLLRRDFNHEVAA